MGEEMLMYKIKTNPRMYILIYFKIQSDQQEITRNALKSQTADLFTKSSGQIKFQFKKTLLYKFCNK